MIIKSKDRPKAIIIITLDALRADHLGCYGYPLPTTPTLDHLAGESARFEHAFCPISLTAPSHASLLTGKNPRFHSIGFHNGLKQLNQDQEVTLPLILRNIGYQTAGFVSIMPLRKQAGLDLGMDIYNDAFTHGMLNRPDTLIRNADQTTGAVLDWVGAHKEQPFFLWVHYSEPHGPYTPPPPYNTQFVGHSSYGPPLSLEAVGDGKEGGIPDYQVLRPQRGADGQLLNSEKDYGYYVSQYDGSIRFLDDQLKVLIQRLQDFLLYDDALIIITADHGESMGENNVYFFHGLTVSLDQIRVPLFVKAPRSYCLKPLTVSAPVTTLDIMPTVLGFCGVEAQYLGLQGLDFFQLLGDFSGAVRPERYIFSEIESQLSVVNEHFQLLCDKSSEAPQRDYADYSYLEAMEGARLFDYVEDPIGRIDISGSHPEDIKTLLAVAGQYLRMPAPRYSEASGGQLSEREAADVKQRLAQLGYLTGPVYKEPVQIDPAETQMSRLKVQVEQLEAQMHKIYSSYSWRLTSPLRKGAAALARFTRVVRRSRCSAKEQGKAPRA